MNIQSSAWLYLGQPSKKRRSNSIFPAQSSLPRAKSTSSKATAKCAHWEKSFHEDSRLLAAPSRTCYWTRLGFPQTNRRPVRSKHRIRLWDCRHSLAADQDIRCNLVEAEVEADEDPKQSATSWDSGSGWNWSLKEAKDRADVEAGKGPVLRKAKGLGEPERIKGTKVISLFFSIRSLTSLHSLYFNFYQQPPIPLHRLIR